VKDAEQTGEIKLTEQATVASEGVKKGKHHFVVKTPGRNYFIYSDREDTTKEWIDAITRNLNSQKGGAPPGNSNNNPVAPPVISSDPLPPISPISVQNNNNSDEKRDMENANPSGMMMMNNNQNNSANPNSSGVSSTNENKLYAAKDVIPFLKNEEGKVLEFWLIWAESIPTKEEQPGINMDYHIATSANLQKLTWRTSGPQNAFIQKMVDFFYNVGAPDSEIDRLNDIGSLINPMKIGSWIDMSANGGMDGGWFFPVDITIKMALEASDEGDPVRKVADWANQNSIERAFSVGRDMGASPPRQTEIRLKLPGADGPAQLEVGLSAFNYFGFPPLPENTLPILRESVDNHPGLCLSIVTSAEGFVRLGLLVPGPSKDIVKSLCSIAGSNASDLDKLHNAIGANGPDFAEYQFLKEGFGYGVYKEGFDVVFHYFIGSGN